MHRRDAENTEKRGWAGNCWRDAGLPLSSQANRGNPSFLHHEGHEVREGNRDHRWRIVNSQFGGSRATGCGLFSVGLVLCRSNAVRHLVVAGFVAPCPSVVPILL